jgi:hypothetical protein
LGPHFHLMHRRSDLLAPEIATAEADADPTEFSHGIPQFLYQMNAGVAKDLNFVMSKFVNGRSKTAAIEAMYLSALSRPVRPAELERLTAYVESSTNPSQAFQDIYWTLLNSAEFTVNH